MESQSPYFVASLLALFVFSCPAEAGASEPDVEQQAAWQQMLARAAELKAEGKAEQAAAEKVFAERTLACGEKFLVNDCRNAARKGHIAAAQAARATENEGKALELAVKKEQAVDRDRRLAVAQQQREADLAARQAEVVDERQAAAERRAQTQANKARLAEEGSQRKAAEAEKYRQQQAAHAARLAERRQETERRAGQAARESK